MKKEKLILIGASGSGKDYYRKKIVEELGINYCPKFTTRPMREGEVEGVEYNFISDLEFDNLILDHKVLFYQRFMVNNCYWIYGYTIENYINSDLVILTPNELECITNLENSKYLENTCIVYLNISEAVRRSRIMKRSDSNDDVDRRIESDRIDFSNFLDGTADVIIRDEYEDPVEFYKSTIL